MSTEEVAEGSGAGAGDLAGLTAVMRTGGVGPLFGRDMSSGLRHSNLGDLAPKKLKVDKQQVHGPMLR